MKIFEVRLTHGLSNNIDSEEGGKMIHFFGSKVRARRFCNKTLRKALGSWKRFEHVDKMSDVEWGESIEIRVLETVDVSKKEMFLRMLNSQGNYFTRHAVLIETWNPQDKWKAPS